MKKLALFAIFVLIFGTMSPSLVNHAYAQNDPSILLRIAVQADKLIVNQLDKKYENNIPNNINILYDKGHTAVKSLDQSLSNNDIETAIGLPSNIPYSIKIELIRNAVNIGGTPTVSSISDIYVDELPNNPTISQQTETAVVTSIIWMMGIPSVKKYKIECTRTYSNINSQYRFIRGDRKLASINSVSNTSNSISSTTFTNDTIVIDRNNIEETGIYTYDVTQFESATNNVLKSLHYTTSRNSTDSNVILNETIYSLKSNGITNNISVFVNHHFDKNSYNNIGNNLSPKLTLTDIYELDGSTISKINSDLGGLIINAYTSHTTIPQNWTLVYYNGLFQTSGYPNVNSYIWDSVPGDYTYNAGLNGLSLSGTEETTGIRYKWIAFRLNKISASQYTFNGNNYNFRIAIKTIIVKCGDSISKIRFIKSGNSFCC